MANQSYGRQEDGIQMSQSVGVENFENSHFQDLSQ